MADPAVSVIMTAYNAERDIEAAVATILGQSFENLELIVVDDGSSDSTLWRLSRTHDRRLRVISLGENRGQTFALNVALNSSRAPLVARQDADDLSHFHRIALQVQEFERRPRLSLLGTQGVVINPNGIITGLLSVPLGQEEILGWLMWDNPFIHTSVMFRRETVERVGGYDERFRICQDYDLWMRILRNATGDNLRQRLVAYRIHKGSLSRSRIEETRREAEEIRTRVDLQHNWRPNSRTQALRALGQTADGISWPDRSKALLNGIFWAASLFFERMRFCGKSAEIWAQNSFRK